jgi:hypothetical protein
MSDLNEDIDSEITNDPWRRKATTAARYDLCNQCMYFAPQTPYKPGVRCKFGLRPDVIFEKEKAVAKCNVFREKT